MTFNCPQLKKQLFLLKAKENTIAVELEELNLTNFKESKVSEVYAIFNDALELINEINEKLHFRELIKSEKQKLEAFFGMPIEVPKLPEEITVKQAEKWKEQGFELHYLPEIEMSQDKDYPGWRERPKKWFYDCMLDGKISITSDELKSGWVLIDGRQKPSQKMQYENDILAESLALLRQDGVIDDFEKKDSRFGIIAKELEKIEVRETLASVLKVQADKMTLPRAIDFNVLGNIHHQEWGTTTNYEWFSDIYDGGYRLYGGISVDGGLSHVNYYPESRRDNTMGFRPMVRF
ncbi:MAG: hypothetical protein WCG01_02275 [bacterium]